MFLSRNRKFIFIILLFIMAISEVNPEKWVGQAATYQLIEGSKTANGDTYDKDGLYAACNGFKLGSKVTVVNSKNGKSITVTINDRIMEESKYFILLTPKAAKDIEFEWDTGLVVVNGDFTNINSEERIAINGLVREGEIDLETIKQFPDIKWPEDKDTINNKVVEKEESLTPDVQKDKTPKEKEKVALLDKDEQNGFLDLFKPKEKSGEPDKEEYLTPESKMREYMMNEDIDDEPLPKKDQEFAMLPEKKDDDTLMDSFKEDEADENITITEKEKSYLLIPENDDKYAMLPKEKDELMDFDEKSEVIPEKEKVVIKPDVEKIPEKEKVVIKPDVEIKPEKETNLVWQKSLDKGVYIRFFTGLDEKASNKKLEMYQKIIPNVIGVKEENKHILFVGPLNKDKIDISLLNIRSYGFRDAYIVTIK